MLTVQQLPLSGWPSRDGGGFFFERVRLHGARIASL